MLTSTVNPIACFPFRQNDFNRNIDSSLSQRYVYLFVDVSIFFVFFFYPILIRRNRIKRIQL